MKDRIRVEVAEAEPVRLFCQHTLDFDVARRFDDNRWFVVATARVTAVPPGPGHPQNGYPIGQPYPPGLQPLKGHANLLAGRFALPEGLCRMLLRNICCGVSGGRDAVLPAARTDSPIHRELPRDTQRGSA